MKSQTPIADMYDNASDVTCVPETPRIAKRTLEAQRRALKTMYRKDPVANDRLLGAIHALNTAIQSLRSTIRQIDERDGVYT